MALTPVEIRHVSLARRPLGYGRAATRELLDEIAESFEAVWRERADLLDRVEGLESELSRHRELEALLRATLVSAEGAARELKDQARREADLVVSEAHAEARSIARRALAEQERLRSEIHRLRAVLAAALATVDEHVSGLESSSKPEAA